MQAIRPDLCRDGPVAKAGAIIPPGAEPAIVEHITLNTDRRRAFGKLYKLVEVVVEIDGFPDVERDGAAGRRMGVSCAEEPVEASSNRVQATPVGAIDPWGAVGLTSLKDDFSGQQQFAAAD